MSRRIEFFGGPLDGGLLTLDRTDRPLLVIQHAGGPNDDLEHAYLLAGHRAEYQGIHAQEPPAG